MSQGSGRVGVRELRQNLSVYLRRVVGGETLEVTERGRAVAVLAPMPETSSVIEWLVASRRAIPPRGTLASMTPPSGTISTRLSEALLEERAERL